MTENPLLCPICYDDIGGSQYVVICPVDKSIHHAACWSYNNHECATYLCDGGGIRKAIKLNSQSASHRKSMYLSNQRAQKNNTKAYLRGFSLLAGIIVLVMLSSYYFTDLFDIFDQQEKHQVGVVSTQEIMNENKKRLFSNRENSEIKQTKSSLTSIPLGYACPDSNDIELYLGAVIKVGDVPVNMRSEPIVPKNSRENVVANLLPGNLLIVIEGPVCSHQGSWWQVQLNNKIEGWVREICIVYGRIIFLHNP